jgi:hypothetical protein
MPIPRGMDPIGAGTIAHERVVGTEAAVVRGRAVVRDGSPDRWIGRAMAVVAALSLALFLTTATLLALEKVRPTATPATNAPTAELHLRHRGMGHPSFDPRP